MGPALNRAQAAGSQANLGFYLVNSEQRLPRSGGNTLVCARVSQPWHY